MCVSSAAARFSSTAIYAGLGYRRGLPVHVLGYQNNAQSRTDAPNCMILHIPSAVPMTPHNMVDTTACGFLMHSLVETFREHAPHEAPEEEAAISTRALRERSNAHVFRKGMYTVVLSASATAAGEALYRVESSRRPTISEELLGFYEYAFPGWHLALCCFSGRETMQSEPLLWWYEPMFPDILYAPATDSHDGGAPDPFARVPRDHEIIFGTSRHIPQYKSYEDQHFRYMPDVRELLPVSARYHALRQETINGDLVVEVDTLHRGALDLYAVPASPRSW